MGVSKKGPFVMIWKKQRGVIGICHPDYPGIRSTDFVLDPYLPLTESSELALQMVCPSLDTEILRNAILEWEKFVAGDASGRADMRDLCYAWYIESDEWI